MPQLSKYQRTGQARVTAQVSKVARMPTTSPAFEGLADIGRDVTEFENRIRASRTQREIAKAEVGIRRDYDSLLRGIEHNPDLDVTQYESSLMEGSAKLREKYAGNIKSREARALFDLRAPGIETDYVIKSRDLMNQRQLDDARAGTIDLLGTFKEASDDLAADTGTLLEAKRAISSYIDEQEKLGFITSDQAEVDRQKVQDIAVAGYTNRVGANVEALIGAGSYREAMTLFKKSYNDLDPTKRDAMENTLEAMAFEAQAVEMVDGFESRGLSDSQMRSEIRQIKDPALRKEAENRRDYLKAEREAARAKDVRDADDRLDNMVLVEGVPYSKTPMELRMRASGSTLRALQNYEAASLRAQANPRQDSDRDAMIAYYDYMMAGDVKAAREFVTTNVDMFDDADFKTYMEATSKEVVPDGLRTNLAMAERVGARSGLNKKQVPEMVDALEAWSFDYQDRNQKKPTDQELEVEAERLAMQYKFRQPGIFDDTKMRGYDIADRAGRVKSVVPDALLPDIAALYVDPTGKGRGDVDVETIEADYAKAVDTLERAGAPASQANVLAVMKRIRERGND